MERRDVGENFFFLDEKRVVKIEKNGKSDRILFERSQFLFFFVF